MRKIYSILSALLLSGGMAVASSIGDIPPSFVTVSETDVTITSFVPSDGAAGVAPRDMVYVSFSQSIAGGDLSGITVNGHPAVNADVVNNNIRLRVFYDFVAGTEYEIIIPAAAVPAYGQDITWHFTTREAFGVESTIPAANVVDVAQDAEVSVLFSGNITTFDNFENEAIPVVTITDNDGVEIETYYTYVYETEKTNKLRINHAAFKNGKRYTVNIPAKVVKEYAAFTDQPITWSFTTVANSILSLVPADGSVGVAPCQTVQVNFAASVAGGDLSGITVNGQPANATVTNGGLRLQVS
jgi:hypothetical protein